DAARHCDAAEDSTPCPVRAHRSNPRSDCGMDCSYASSDRRFPVSQSSPQFSALVYASIRPDCGLMGARHWTRSGCLWDAYHATDQGIADLPTHEKPEG